METKCYCGHTTRCDCGPEVSYSEEEVLHLLDTLWDRLDIWYNEKVDREFNLIDWFNQCELKKK